MQDVRWMDQFYGYIVGHPDQVVALVAVCALFVSFMSIVLTAITLVIQRKHNLKSVTPIASIQVQDYENQLAVKLKNNGIGPLILERFVASDGHDEKGDIISWMPDHPVDLTWDTFYSNLDGISIPPNKEVVIVRLIGDPEDKKFASFRDQVRHALSKLRVRVNYKDIYNRRMPVQEQDLLWFGRTIQEKRPS